MMSRAIILLALAVIAAGTYVTLLLGTPYSDIALERRLGGLAPGERGIRVYIEPITIDAVRDSMQLRVSVEPAGPGADERLKLSDRDLNFQLTHDNSVEQIGIRARQPTPATTFEIDLYDGDIVNYPFDDYRGAVSLLCLEAGATPDAQPLPMEITVWERAVGFRLRAAEGAGAPRGERSLTFVVQRGRAVVFFALAIYAAMVVLAIGSATIGTLTFLAVRRPEATLIGAMGAIIFALPALRNALPGGAPLGVWADEFVFLWAELAAVISLSLMVATWARAGPRP